MEKKNLFVKYIDRIEHSDTLSIKVKLKAYYRLFQLILEELSDDNKVNFTSLFSRIAYVGAKIKLEGRLLYLLHSLRRAHENEKVNAENVNEFLVLAIFCCNELLNKAYKTGLSSGITADEVYRKFSVQSEDLLSFSPIMRGLINSIDTDKKYLIFIDENDGVKELKVKYDISHKNEIFTKSLESLTRHIPFPLHINLIDVEVMKGDILVPKAFVVEPDYMIDVTGIANTFKFYGTEPLEAVVKKFRPSEMSVHLLLGNIANFLLDELVNSNTSNFKELIPKIFQLSPLQFSCLDDNSVISVLQKAKQHYDHLKHVVSIEFEKESINTKAAYLEPSFYSRDYGIQGRLDLLHEDAKGHHFDIVELKSGSPFMPNNYGLSVQHYTQTLLYDLIVKSVYKGRKKTSNYILYSKEEDWQLRNAPVLKVQQYEALKTRNDLLLIEAMLTNLSEDKNDNILNQIKPSSFPKAKGFLKQHIQEFNDTYKGLTSLEKAYFNMYSKFVAREHKLAKVGEHGLSKANGLAALWLEEREEKEDRFSILHTLEITENASSAEVPTIELTISDKSPELSRFRKGDIVVLYPQSGVRSILYNQIFKCNIIELSSDKVKLKLRSRQYNQEIFKSNRWWAIEGDVMDSSFLSMYRSLYGWACSSMDKRKLILGIVSPEKVIGGYEYHSEEMTEEQNHILNCMIHSKDYYLLWGPPGTGKTSVIIKHLVKYLHHYTTEKILLVAYTNRAVDEICEAIINGLAGEKNPLLRIGSSHSCDPKYKPYLLDQQVSLLGSRKEILSILKNQRIIVSTVSSIINRVEIFHLYDFDTIIIDEASQILEPMIVGLLPKFDRFIMIGDHKQLPAVVVQNSSDTEIENELLHDKGFKNANISLFERLYNRCVSKDWTQAFGILRNQGRMHVDLMKYPNKYFYENNLRAISGIDRLTKNDHIVLPEKSSSALWNSRMTYIPTPVDEEFSWKTNREEANKVVDIIREIHSIYMLNEKEWTTHSLGVITPYRAQIAMIRKKIQKLLPPSVGNMITVDTVERYQGGARDIIVISLCTNRQDQMERLVSLSQDGIDRKLNVALTRARDRIYILGNKEILKQDINYSRLLDMTYTISSPS